MAIYDYPWKTCKALRVFFAIASGVFSPRECEERMLGNLRVSVDNPMWGGGQHEPRGWVGRWVGGGQGVGWLGGGREGGV